MPSAPLPSTAEAFAHCEQLARAHYENFPVGSLLIPKVKRQHVYSIYAFARTADDFADEGEYEPAIRLRQLNEWQTQLDECYAGRATHPIFIALAHTVKELQIEKSLLSDLLSAFKQDVAKRRYANFSEVLDYCTRSAHPVGRLILRLFDYRQPKLDELSDAICTALQLTNFWQDLAVDILKDRIYLPEDEMAAANLTINDLRSRDASPALRQLIKFQVARTRELFERGKPLPDLVKGRLAVELRLTWYSGLRILELIEQQQFDTLARRPKLNTVDKFRLLTRALLRV